MSSYDEVWRQQDFAREVELGRAATRDRNYVAWKLTMLVMPWVCLVAVTVYWIGVFANRASGPYRTVLEAVFGDGWVTQQAGVPGRSDEIMVIVGLVLLALVIGLTVLRRMGTGRWARGGMSPVVLWPWCFGATLVRTMLLVAAPALVLTAGSIAYGADLEAAQHGVFDDPAALRSWPMVLTAGVLVWFSIGATVRSARKAKARWFDLRWQGLDGRWYTPVQPAGTWDPGSGLWLGTDGGWYPPPADAAGPAGPATGWWQAADGHWYPPQNWAPRIPR